MKKRASTSGAGGGFRPIDPASERPRTVAPGPRDELVKQVTQQFRQVFTSVKRHSDWVEARCGVTSGQLWALVELRRRPGLRVSEFAAALYVHQSTASNLVDRLMLKALVRRERCGEDQRVVRLYLTEEGERIAARAPDPAQGVLSLALEKMSDPALKGLHVYLNELVGQVRRLRSDFPELLSEI